MGLYLYCVGPPSHPEPESVEGVEGGAVRSLDTAGMRAWVSHLDAAPAASLERVRAHNAVVEAAGSVSTPLPMRFGQWFPSEEALVDTLNDRRLELERSLERVRGAVEFGVRVLAPAEGDVGPPERSSGRSYLESLARREEVAESSRRLGAEVAVELRRFLGPLVRDQQVRPGGSSGLVAIAHLVARHDTGAYDRRVHTFTEHRTDLRFVISGPWPPYGFVDDGS